jgi:hypothetical protein
VNLASPFVAPPTSSTPPSTATSSSSPSTLEPHPGRSFLASGESLVKLDVTDVTPSSWSTNNRSSNPDVRPGSSNSRPPTASHESADSHPRSLPTTRSCRLITPPIPMGYRPPTILFFPCWLQPRHYPSPTIHHYMSRYSSRAHLP